MVAERQTAGRGRPGRQWLSPPRAGLALSVLLRPGVAVPSGAGRRRRAYGWLPLLAGVALLEAVRRVAERRRGPEVAQRPAASGRREVRRDPGRGGRRRRRGASGIGLNVTTRARRAARHDAACRPPRCSWPAPRAPTATRCCGRCCAGSRGGTSGGARPAATRSWRAAGGVPAGLRDDRPRVRVLLPGGASSTGEATTGDVDGRLVIRTADGAEHASRPGDVLHVR